MANPLPAVRSFLPYTQARSRLGGQSLSIDRFQHCDCVGDHDVIAVDGRFEIAQRELTEIVRGCYWAALCRSNFKTVVVSSGLERDEHG